MDDLDPLEVAAAAAADGCEDCGSVWCDGFCYQDEPGDIPWPDDDYAV